MTVAITSTLVPGTTNPATPITSLTFTDIARMPAGMVGGRPPPDAFGASLPSVIGSFSPIVTMAPRSTTASTEVKEPGTGLLDGHPTSFTLSADNSEPTGIGAAATAILTCATSTCRTGIRWTARYTA